MQNLYMNINAFIFSYILNCEKYEHLIKQKVAEYCEQYFLREKQLYEATKILAYIEEKKQAILNIDEHFLFHVLNIRHFAVSINQASIAGTLEMSLVEYVELLKAEHKAQFESPNDFRQKLLLILMGDYNISYELALKYLSEENEKEDMSSVEQCELLLIVTLAKNEFIQFLNQRTGIVHNFIQKKEKERLVPKLPEPLRVLQWNGTNETEFVQFVYGLFHAGKIGMTEGENEITKLVPQMAKLLNFELGEYWQGNHSKSIHNRNKDYEPSIFTEILNGYKKYSTDIEEKKTKKK